MKIWNRVREIRERRKLTVAELARGAGVRRQTVYSIESGSYIPNTEIALRLARVLDVGLDDLFGWEETGSRPVPLQSRLVSVEPLGRGQALRLARVGESLVGVAATADPTLPWADGAVDEVLKDGTARVELWGEEPDWSRRILIAGCDPGLSILAHEAGRRAGLEVVTAHSASRQALQYLADGVVHLAGSHLRDPAGVEFNLPLVQALFSQRGCRVITFAAWEEGLLVRPGNPRGILDFTDLGRADVRIANREIGSGSRALLDRKLGEIGLSGDQVQGYPIAARGHLEAARMVWNGEADCCLAVRSAAQAFGLDFIPVEAERFDLVMLQTTLDVPAVRTLLDLMSGSGFCRKLERLAGYVTRETGKVQLGG